MEIAEKKLRQIFMELFDEAFHALILPRFDALESRMDALEARMYTLESRVETLEAKLSSDILAIKDHTYPLLYEIKIDIKALCQDITKLTQKTKIHEQDLRQTQSVVSALKKELVKATSRLTRFEERLRALRANPKRKTSR